jgi:hypothetical protein
MSDCSARHLRDCIGPHGSAGGKAVIAIKKEAEASLRERRKRLLGFQGAGAVDRRSNLCPSESPARQSGFLGSWVVMSVALPAPVVALSASPPPLRGDEPELCGAPELS